MAIITHNNIFNKNAVLEFLLHHELLIIKKIFTLDTYEAVL